MHYAFDIWMACKFPSVRFERYVDDAVVHCISEEQALMVRDVIAERLAEVGLRLHPEKTKVVYCQDWNRRTRSYEHTSFTFLGYEFRARTARDRNGRMFGSFLPAISKAGSSAAAPASSSAASDRAVSHTGDWQASSRRVGPSGVSSWRTKPRLPTSPPTTKYASPMECLPDLRISGRPQSQVSLPDRHFRASTRRQRRSAVNDPG